MKNAATWIESETKSHAALSTLAADLTGVWSSSEFRLRLLSFRTDASGQTDAVCDCSRAVVYASAWAGSPGSRPQNSCRVGSVCEGEEQSFFSGPGVPGDVAASEPML